MSKTKQRSLVSSSAILGVLILLGISLTIGATFYYFVEGLSVVDAVYFASMTLTTVGYGDFVPKTDLGKMFTAAYAFIGIGTFLGFAAIMSQVALSRMHLLRENFQKI